MKRIMILAAALAVLAGCGGEKHSPDIYCSAKGGQAAFSELRSHMRKQSNFYMAAEHKPIIQYMGDCKHGVLAVAERKSSAPGVLKSYSAEVTYDRAAKRWVISNLDAD